MSNQESWLAVTDDLKRWSRGLLSSFNSSVATMGPVQSSPASKGLCRVEPLFELYVWRTGGVQASTISLGARTASV